MRCVQTSIGLWVEQAMKLYLSFPIETKQPKPVLFLPSVGVEPTSLAFRTSALPMSYEGVLREGIEPSTSPVSEECFATELPQQIKNRQERTTN